jgi:hypothetical protein
VHVQKSSMQNGLDDASVLLAEAMQGLKETLVVLHGKDTPSHEPAGECAHGPSLPAYTGGEPGASDRNRGRKRKDAAGEEENASAKPGQTRHVVAKPSIAAVTCEPLACMTLPCAHCTIHAHQRTSLKRADGSELPISAAEDLRKRADRIQMSTEGEHAPSVERLGPQTITHALLMLADDTVKGCASKLSGKAQFRLLAWLLADAMSAGTPLDKPLAETVGKRLGRQVQRVRTELVAVADRAEKERGAARDAAALAGLAVDPKNERLQTQLAGQLSATDALEAEELDKLRREVYIGFVELGLEAPQEAPAVPTLLSTPVTEPVGPTPTEEEEAEEREFEHWRTHGGALPQVLAERLGAEGVRMLQELSSGATHRTGDSVLDIGIPLLVKFVLQGRARERAEHYQELQEMRRECERDVARAEARAADAAHDESIADDECESLRAELAREKARNEQLMEVVVNACLRQYHV